MADYRGLISTIGKVELANDGVGTETVYTRENAISPESIVIPVQVASGVQAPPGLDLSWECAKGSVTFTHAANTSDPPVTLWFFWFTPATGPLK